MMRALVLLLLGLPPILAILFLPSYLVLMREELAWRAKPDPYEFLTQWRGMCYNEMALAQLDEAQRPHGYIARFISSPYGVSYRRGRQTLAATWNHDESQVLTAGATIAERWNALTGEQLQTYGESKRRDAPDSRQWGFGFTQVAWYAENNKVVALTSGPSSLFFFDPVAAPWRIADKGVESFVARGNRAAFVESFERGQVADLTSRQITQLPHTDVSAIALADDGVVVTATRQDIQWWRDGKPERRTAIEAPYNPQAISTDARWVIGSASRHALLWATRNGEPLAFGHASEVTAVCALGELVATGTDDGRVHLWAMRGSTPLRSIRASTAKIDALTCGHERLISVSYDQTDVRAWNLDGRPSPGMVATPTPPRQEWIVSLGADVDLPNRFPGLMAWIDADSAGARQPWAVGALVVLVILAFGLAKGTNKGKRAGSR